VRRLPRVDRSAGFFFTLIGDFEDFGGLNGRDHKLNRADTSPPLAKSMNNKSLIRRLRHKHVAEEINSVLASRGLISNTCISLAR
jgi:hypothetical protein